MGVEKWPNFFCNLNKQIIQQLNLRGMNRAGREVFACFSTHSPVTSVHRLALCADLMALCQNIPSDCSCLPAALVVCNNFKSSYFLLTELLILWRVKTAITCFVISQHMFSFCESFIMLLLCYCNPDYLVTLKRGINLNR